MTPKPDFSAGTFTYEVRRLIEAGLAVEENQVWSYKAMASLIGKEVTGNLSSLQTALERLSRDHGREFKNIRGVGYVRLDDSGIVAQGSGDRLGVNRKLKRAATRSQNVRDYHQLEDHYKVELNTHRAIIGAMRRLVQPGSVKRIRQEVSKSLTEPDLDRILQLFKPKKGEDK